jgi:hypothetical protein
MYRYSSKKFSSLLLALGIISIGALYDFRKLEHKKGISDSQEGKKVVAHTIEDLHVEDPNDPVYQNSKDFTACKAFRAIDLKGTNTTFQNVTLGSPSMHLIVLFCARLKSVLKIQ